VLPPTRSKTARSRVQGMNAAQRPKVVWTAGTLRSGGDAASDRCIILVGNASVEYRCSSYNKRKRHARKAGEASMLSQVGPELLVHLAVRSVGAKRCAS
jgi:hypothetical protein